MVASVGRSNECHVRYSFEATFLQGLGELGECLCFDSHCCYLVRFAVLTVLDLPPMSGIQFVFRRSTLRFDRMNGSQSIRTTASQAVSKVYEPGLHRSVEMKPIPKIKVFPRMIQRPFHRILSVPGVLT